MQWWVGADRRAGRARHDDVTCLEAVAGLGVRLHRVLELLVLAEQSEPLQGLLHVCRVTAWGPSVDRIDCAGTHNQGPGVIQLARPILLDRYGRPPPHPQAPAALPPLQRMRRTNPAIAITPLALSASSMYPFPRLRWSAMLTALSAAVLAPLVC